MQAFVYFPKAFYTRKSHSQHKNKGDTGYKPVKLNHASRCIGINPGFL